ncbi:MAG: GDSL-type esterase/lipase family protein [Paludibacteraceae bacterium]|nr:GDSL-type esterase/lipase family protein [Paludibacteraceae bacterium]
MKRLFTLLSLIWAITFSAIGQYRIIPIGDSTVQDYNDGYAPRKGWGQMLPFFFDKSKVTVLNKAIGGTSSKSFYEKHWTAVRDQLKAGDFVFIQFGINDRNSSDANRYAPGDVFKSYIKKFVDDTRAKKAIPVLVSTVRRCAWTNGKPYDSYHEHPQLMRDMAASLKTPLVDLDKFCYDLFVSQGELYATRFLTMHLEAGEYANYPKGNTDQVHYQEMGATENARFVVETIEKSTDENLKKLAACTLPRHKVTITINDKTKTKAITRTASFPEGINITLKTISQDKAKFLRWEDGDKKQITTKTLYTLKMGNKDVTYKAVYESNVKEEAAPAEKPELKIDNAQKALVASAAKSYKWYFNNSAISGATSSTLKIDKNGTYSVEMTMNDGSKTRLDICVTIGTDGVIRKVFLIGDSTVCDYKESQFPMTGWGQVLKYFFNGNIQIVNHAIGGRSSRSFREQGRWNTVLKALAPGDFVFIQFGHNDRDNSKKERYTPVNDYKLRLDSFVTEARAKGAIPVLVSPMVMNAWKNNEMRNVFTESGNDYRGAMAEVAKARNCPFVDLNMRSFNYFKQFNSTFLARFYYNNYAAGEYANYKDGNSDNTHFQEMGAITLCSFIVDELKKINNPYTEALVKYMKPAYQLTVNANIEGAGSITQNIQLPEGTPATVKVLPATGKTFENWRLDGTQKTTSNIYRFTMPDKATTATANFKGGTKPFESPVDTFVTGDKKVAYFTDKTVENYTIDKILPMLQQTAGLYVEEFDAQLEKADLSGFDLVVISEVVPSTAPIMSQLQNMEKPTLNLKVHAYKNATNAWKWATTGFGDNIEQTGITINADKLSHPIFKGLNIAADNSIEMLKSVNSKGLTYMNAESFTKFEGTVESIAQIEGLEQTNILEVKAGSSINGVTIQNKMLQIGINSSSYALLTDDAKQLLVNGCFYLMTPEGDLTSATSTSCEDNVKRISYSDGKLLIDGKFGYNENLIIVNAKGMLLKNMKVQPDTEHQIINITDLQNGIYIIKTNSYHTKIIKD